MRKEEILLQITFINVGNGDAILIAAPVSDKREEWFYLLIDGGSGEEQEYVQGKTGRIPVAEYLQLHGISHLDAVINTHIHEDHTCGLMALPDSLLPRNFYTPYPLELSKMLTGAEILAQEAGDRESLRKMAAALKAYRDFDARVRKMGGRTRQLSLGDRVPMPEGTTLKVLGPLKDPLTEQLQRFWRLLEQGGRDVLSEIDRHMNGTSLCLMLRCGAGNPGEGKQVDILLPGDTEASGYPPEEQASIKADIWKAGHHGQRNSLTEPLLRRIRPSLAVICASSDRRYESACPEVLSMLQGSGAELLFTDCPEVPPFTEGLRPHRACSISVFRNGTVAWDYETEGGMKNECSA